MGSQTQSQLHVVDFTDEAMKPGTDAWLSACTLVRTALEDNGCFLARYHRIGKDLCDSVVSSMEDLFSLPVETKAQNTRCQKFAHIMGLQGNHRFCESINKYAKLLGELDHMTKRMVFESYGVEMQGCECMIESSDYLLRCMKYRTPETDEKDLGMPSHTDLTIVSIVHQLNNLNGLEIKLKDGEWIGVDASSSLFLVVVGDAFHVWSNGRIRPYEHRVTMNATKTRYSMGLFSFSGKILQIPAELVNEQHPLRYKSILDNYEYIRFYEKEKSKDPYSRIEAYCGISSLY
ncbi:hypothetical protein PHAVU_001G127500 [Phaseolus vulgaris]|uniref:Fe2OG dioxygenase domain-containing protein n=1 Tax=Phaseolus vulgaris TaxID=3885 RepID=V7CVK7_PHAVU|nr:hypothetical protein PHAVU_001G127500g [Phaseolus vulgaris]ESW34134.1 hypothetical protein PHAVU_001G127500g [Phaseolus vulgaris]